MVQGLNRFERRWTAIPRAVRQAAIEAMEKSANELVAEMDQIKPLPEILIDWTWGDPPSGSIALGTVDGSQRGLAITIYARGDDFAAHWFEFGTDPRFHKSGKYVGQITASPFFFPIWRARRRRVRARLTRAIGKAIRSK